MGRAAGARDLALALTLGERFENFRFPIRDRGSNFIRSLGAVFQANGTGIRQAAIQAPRMNATCDRLLDVLRRELLDRMLILSEAHLRAVLIEYQVHYNTARPHQGIAQRVPGNKCQSSRRHSSQPRCPPNPPKIHTERADQRI